MAMTPSTAGDFAFVRSPFSLQTQQKRVRHLRTICVRNLHSKATGKEPLSRLQSYFTLHTHVDAKAFYQSERITGSTNPSWQSFDISQFENQISLASKYVVVRVWVGHDDSVRLLILMEVHLSGLHFLSDKLQQLLVKHSPNMVIFGMLDKQFVFINKEQTRIKHLTKKVGDLELPSTLLPAVIKVEKGTVRNSYTTSALSRIQTVQRAIKQMQAHARRHRRQIEDRLLDSQENSERFEERENLHMSVGQLRQELLRRTTLLHQSQEKLRSLKQHTASTLESVKENTDQQTQHWQVIQEDKRDHIVKREQLVKENALLNLRRRQMLNELFCYIYPITQDGSKYLINNIRLPHAEDLQGQDETMVAVGLGYSCHLTIKMAQVLGLPLRHPMDNRGSKSVIIDQVHSKLADKDREFPLYSKGKDKNHFNYGVFLLNKNISQLRYQCSLATLDLRQTLQNLLTLMHKLGVRVEGDSSGVSTLTSTPEGTAVSRMSQNGSSIGATPSQALFNLSANGDVNKSQGSKSGHQHSKTSDFSEDGSTADPPSSRHKDEHFDESEDIFKPTSDDHFFHVSSSSMEEFNALGERGDTVVKSDKSGKENSKAYDKSGKENSEADTLRVSAILQTASEGQTLSPKSFQLLRRKRKEGGSVERDANNSGENGFNSDVGECDDNVDDSGRGDEVGDWEVGGQSLRDGNGGKGEGGKNGGGNVQTLQVTVHSQPSPDAGESLLDDQLPRLSDIDPVLVLGEG